ncbi:hypothetical protein NLM24_31635 [Nocardia zapadnayensis]|uniref:hypothetical protein n=1 Tax=Nocardia rhamnosiphila TaxID=426716 RepID=UPI0022479551|nr:hypothetical protein [Nocardia zapadnayensis]MCX0275161.1 hypothetical protein [Nocardia zapadnayensis]
MVSGPGHQRGAHSENFNFFGVIDAELAQLGKTEAPASTGPHPQHPVLTLSGAPGCQQYSLCSQS